MRFSVDTNILFGVLNEEGRLSGKSKELIRFLEGDFLLTENVRRETCKRYSEKFLSAITPLVKFYKSINPVFYTEAQIQTLEGIKLGELVKRSKDLTNFYKLAIKVARKARSNNDNSIIGLMDYYNEIVDCNRLINNIQTDLLLRRQIKP